MLSKEEQEIFEMLGDQHGGGATDTPLRADAFEKTDEEKIDRIADLFGGIMKELGLDLGDDSLKGTPYRVAKMYVKELFSGLDPRNKPKLSVFENKYRYKRILIEKDIRVHSSCEHHFLPIVGKAHVAYIAESNVIGLSKINRIVDYYARRPQVQERLSQQIFQELKMVLGSDSVIVVIEAEHLCVSSRGVKDTSSKTTTMVYGGAFDEPKLREEFFALL